MCVEVKFVFYCVFLWRRDNKCVNCASTCYTAKEAGSNWFEPVERKHTQLCAFELQKLHKLCTFSCDELRS